MINLCLVVIATQFAETKKREMERMRAERARFASSSTLASSTNNSEPATCYAEIVKYVAHLWRRFKRRMAKKIRFLIHTFLIYKHPHKYRDIPIRSNMPCDRKSRISSIAIYLRYRYCIFCVRVAADIVSFSRTTIFILMPSISVANPDEYFFTNDYQISYKFAMKVIFVPCK